MKEFIVLDNLNQSVSYMNSEDYKKRLVAEYAQAITRFDKLAETVCKYDGDMLDFELSCPVDLLHMQLEYMNKYIIILETRARIEGVDLTSEMKKLRGDD